MRKMLSIVGMLVVALIISANLPRAGPDMVLDSDMISVVDDNTAYLNAFHDIGAIFVIVSTEPLTAEQSDAVISSLRESRSSLVVHQDRRNVQLRGYNDMTTLLDFRLSYQTDTGWRPMRT